jgi:heme exporter protein C
MLRYWLSNYSMTERLLVVLPNVLLLVVVSLIVTQILHRATRTTITRVLLVLGLVMLVVQAYLGLVWAPPEKYMGDTYRIFYVHVPQLWMAMMALTLNFGCSIAFLFRKSWVTDSLAEASAAVGLYFGVVGVALGSIWARPTWGAWWTWDPRLTTAAILLVVYAGYVALRRFIDDADRRAVFSSVMGILSFVLVPVLWFSVKWWRSMHQVQSSPATVDPSMVMVLRWSVTAFLALLGAFLYYRYQIAFAARQRETVPPPLEPLIDNVNIGARA